MVTHYEDIISFAWCCVWESYVGLILRCTVRDRRVLMLCCMTDFGLLP